MTRESMMTFHDLADILDGLPLLMREARRARRMTPKEVADEIGIASTTVWRLEKGQGCTLKNASAILRWFDTGGGGAES